MKPFLPEAEIVKLPMADGGEGTVDALVDSTGGRYVETVVASPVGEKIRAKFGLIHDDKVAVIDAASACGLSLVPLKKRNPMKTTTYGVGELIKKALDYEPEVIMIGLGGSSTVDGGRYRTSSRREIPGQK